MGTAIRELLEICKEWPGDKLTDAAAAELAALEADILHWRGRAETAELLLGPQEEAIDGLKEELLALAGAEKHLERVPGHVSQNEGDGWRWKDERLEAELAECRSQLSERWHGRSIVGVAAACEEAERSVTLLREQRDKVIAELAECRKAREVPGELEDDPDFEGRKKCSACNGYGRFVPDLSIFAPEERRALEGAYCRHCGGNGLEPVPIEAPPDSKGLLERIDRCIEQENFPYPMLREARAALEAAYRRLGLLQSEVGGKG